MFRPHRLRPNLLLAAALLAGSLTTITVAQETVAAAAPTTKELLEIARRPGPSTVATLSEKDGIRNGPDYRGGTIHYPTRKDGSIAEGGPFPIMAISPGFNASEGSVRPWGRYLASHGIVTMTLGTNTPSDRPRSRGKALLDAIETVQAENTREGSPLQGRLAVDRTGVAGWSMGGGGAQHAAVMDASLKGVVAMVPWQPVYRFEHGVPVMILAGEKDNVASTRTHSRPHFDNTPDSTPKLLFEIRGGGHFLPGSPGNHRGEVGAWTLAWIKTFVENDPAWRGVLELEPSTASIYELSLPGETSPVKDEAPAEESTAPADRD